MTPVAYTVSLRMVRARQLLTYRDITGFSIAEIAEKCGFYDTRYFSRVFKKETGFTPLEYSKKAIAEAARDRAQYTGPAILNENGENS